MVNVHKSSIGGIVNFILMYLLTVLWPVDPLLGNDREIRIYTTAVTKQRSVNKNRGTLFSERSVQRCYKQDQLVR
jgi:hypothetical protein